MEQADRVQRHQLHPVVLAQYGPSDRLSSRRLAVTSNDIASTERTSAALQPAFHDAFEFRLPEYTINAAAAINADA